MPDVCRESRAMPLRLARHCPLAARVVRGLNPPSVVGDLLRIVNDYFPRRRPETCASSIRVSHLPFGIWCVRTVRFPCTRPMSARCGPALRQGARQLDILGADCVVPALTVALASGTPLLLALTPAHSASDRVGVGAGPGAAPRHRGRERLRRRLRRVARGGGVMSPARSPATSRELPSGSSSACSEWTC